MKRILSVLLVLSAAMVNAQDIAIESGEHEDFTRLAITFPTLTNWQFGRTTDGYGLWVESSMPEYDLNSVFDRINHNRLESVTMDSEDKFLKLALACDCHAIPFEYGPNSLVIDIKDGKAPPGSIFEMDISELVQKQALQAQLLGASMDKTHSMTTYDWLAEDRVTQPSPPVMNKTSASQTKDMLQIQANLGTFRSMLVNEVGRGASTGIVEMNLPPSKGDETGTEDQSDAIDTTQARIALEGLPENIDGVAISGQGQSKHAIMTDGRTCPLDGALEISDWGATNDALADLSLAEGTILQEFDIPDREKVINAARMHIYYGFGAEARNILRVFPQRDANLEPLFALSYLIEGADVPTNPFVAMQSCDSSAALWAVLAVPPPRTLDHVNGKAISRSFLALPRHLRAFLGLVVYEALIEVGDEANAEIVKQSYQRISDSTDPNSVLIEAEAAMHDGDPAAAEAALQDLEGGQGAMDALITLIESRFQRQEPVSESDVIALQAFSFEHGDGPRQAEFDRALSHAFALSGDFGAAFDRASSSSDLTKDVWALLANTGQPSDVLQFAVGPSADVIQDLDSQLRAKMAERLVEIGLPNAASEWAVGPDVEPPLAASIALANNDARSALRLLSSDPDIANKALEALAYQSLGAYDQSAAAFEASGNLDAAGRMRRWQGIWPTANDPASDPWADLATRLPPTAGSDNLPSLQASEARLESSVQTRAAIATLLASVPTVASDAVP